MADHTTQRRLAAILAADVAAYTRRMEEDSDGTVAAWQRLVELLRSYDMQREQIVSIDLRLPDRAVLGLRPNDVMDGNST
jgi:uncharacterized membrane protein YccC